jgi:hypothetical protein
MAKHERPSTRPDVLPPLFTVERKLSAGVRVKRLEPEGRIQRPIPGRRWIK